MHHGLPSDLYRLQPHPGDYFAFLGRLSPEKRLDRAIEIAKRVGMPLKVAARIDAIDREYLHREVEPLLDHPLVEFVGELGDTDKQAFLGNARALLFPIDWPEPFGLVMIEAMACGTPVIAYRHGSVPEVVENGVNGLVVDDLQQAVDAARQVHALDRRLCREVFELRFSSSRMARDYVGIYRQLGRRGRAREAAA